MLNKTNHKLIKTNENGFTIVEAVVAILILTIGLIGTAAAITYALEFGSISRNVTSAKSVVVSAIEEIETLRNSRRLNFKQVANVGGVDNVGSSNPFNGFGTGFKPVSLSPGPDGVNGTDDDLRDAGPDGVFGTADDFDNQGLIRSGYTRQITITNLSNTLKKVEIKVRYLGRAGKTGEIVGVSYLNDEARTNW
ncbi:MAG: type IV pilus modification PilV family protein [Pyrinomonadaceae bacterium]